MGCYWSSRRRKRCGLERWWWRVLGAVIGGGAASSWLGGWLLKEAVESELGEVGAGWRGWSGSCLTSPQELVGQAATAAIHGLNSSQAHHPPGASMDAGWGACQPDGRRREGRGRGWRGSSESVMNGSNNSAGDRAGPEVMVAVWAGPRGAAQARLIAVQASSRWQGVIHQPPKHFLPAILPW